MARAQRGDAEAFRALYSDTQPRLLRYLHALAGKDAEDVASEAWLQIVRDLSGFAGDLDQFRGLAATVARHRALDHLRRQGRRPAAVPVPVDDLAGLPGDDDTAERALDAVATRAAVALIATLIATLPPDQAEAVLLRTVVRAVSATGLSAVVGTVGDTTGRPLASLLAGLAAIETAGRAHHEVIARLAEVGPVVPLRFATVYRDDATIRNLVAQRRANLTQMVESFRDTQEWDVKIYMDLGPDGSRNYLSRHLARRILAAPRAERIAHALTGIAVATHRRPASLPLAGETQRLVVDGAYPLDTERAQEFAGIVEPALTEHAGLRAELTGPWPPYSFADR